MVNGVIYKCTECDERFFFTTAKDSIRKAPCPYCDTCTLELEKDKTDPISAEKTAGDLFDEISAHNGR